MTLIEILTVIGVIVVLIAILLPGLNSARKQAVLAKSQNNLRQIATFLTAYAQANRDTVVPAAFDYSTQTNDPRVRVRTASPPGVLPPVGVERVGSWSDILWTENKLGPIVDNDDPANYNYGFDSPDRVLYEKDSAYDQNVLRSAARMTRTSGGTDALPFGTGSQSTEANDPGYFACNEFFDVRPPDATNPQRGKWWVMGQIVRPALSVYLVDSFAGEVTETTGSTVDDLQVQSIDYRYNGDNALMLFLDGHVEPQTAWETLRDLEEGRQIRFRDLDRSKPFYQP